MSKRDRTVNKWPVVIMRSRVRARMLRRFLAGESMASIALRMRISLEAVEQCIRWELQEREERTK
jgi:hypothetical protein